MVGTSGLLHLLHHLKEHEFHIFTNLEHLMLLTEEQSEQATEIWLLQSLGFEASAAKRLIRFGISSKLLLKNKHFWFLQQLIEASLS